jgi:hypothetical protein
LRIPAISTTRAVGVPEGRQAFRYALEGLFVAGVGRHLRPAEQARIVERPGLEDNRAKAEAARHNLGTRSPAGLAGDGAFEIVACELPRRAARVFETLWRHQDDGAGYGVAGLDTV